MQYCNANFVSRLLKKERSRAFREPGFLFTLLLQLLGNYYVSAGRISVCVCVCVGLSSHGQYTFTIAFAWLLECSKNAKCTTKHRLTNHSYSCTFFKKEKFLLGKNPRKYEMSDHNLILHFLMNPSPLGAKSNLL